MIPSRCSSLVLQHCWFPKLNTHLTRVSPLLQRSLGSFPFNSSSKQKERCFASLVVIDPSISTQIQRVNPVGRCRHSIEVSMLIDSRSGVLSPPTGQPFAKTVLVATVKVPTALKSGSNNHQLQEGPKNEDRVTKLRVPGLRFNVLKH